MSTCPSVLSGAWRTRVFAALGALLLVAPAMPAAAANVPAAPPDLHLEWLEGGVPTRDAPGLEGEAGQTLTLRYVVRNVGGSDAFAVVLAENTSLGRLSAPRRVQPGPAAGAALARLLRLSLAPGIREVCIQATLQTERLADPEDPNPENNVLCRRVRVRPAASPEERIRNRALGQPGQEAGPGRAGNER